MISRILLDEYKDLIRDELIDEDLDLKYANLEDDSYAEYYAAKIIGPFVEKELVGCIENIIMQDDRLYYSDCAYTDWAFFSLGITINIIMNERVPEDVFSTIENELIELVGGYSNVEVDDYIQSRKDNISIKITIPKIKELYEKSHKVLKEKIHEAVKKVCAGISDPEVIKEIEDTMFEDFE